MNKLSLKETLSYIKEDAFRLSQHKTLKQKLILIFICLIDSKFGILLWFRISRYLFLKKNVVARILFIPSLVFYRILQHWTGIQIPVRVSMMGGAKISHFSDIVIVGESVIGKNLTIMQGVTIGRGFSKKNYGCPRIGDNVIIFTGSKELEGFKDTIKQYEDEILNYFDKRETNASAESLNSKMKCFRSSMRGVRDIPFFFYRSMMVFG